MQGLLAVEFNFKELAVPIVCRNEVEQSPVIAAGEHRPRLHAVEMAEDAEWHLVFF